MAEAPRKAPSGQAAKGAPIGIKLTKQQQQNLVVVVIFAVGIIYGYVKFLFLPSLDAYKIKTATLEEKKKELQDARNMVAKYPEFLKRASEISGRTEFINRRLPQDANVAETIKEITKSATECNINIIDFAPGKETIKGDYREMEIKVSFMSTYADLGNFLTRLGYIERLTTSSQVSIKVMTVEEQKLASRVGKENLAVEMYIKIYSFI